MDQRVDLALAGVITVLGLVLFVMSQNIALGQIQDPIGPRGVPTAIAVFFIVAGSTLVVRRLRGMAGGAPIMVESEGTLDEPGHPASARRAFAIIAVCAMYLLLLPVLGFLLVTPVMLGAIMWLLGVRPGVLLVAVAVGYTLIVYVTFTQLLSVELPDGVLTAPLEALGIS